MFLAAEAALKASPRCSGRITADGKFKVHDLPVGKYKIELQLEDGRQHESEFRFEVKELGDGIAIDIGEFKLKTN